MWLFSIIIVGLLYLFNAIYNFLPKDFIQKYPPLKYAGVIVALILVGIFIIGEIGKYQRSSYAEVSKEGGIIRSKNFSWKITKTKHSDGNIVYIINDRRGDSTEISIFPDNSTKKYFVRDAFDGMAIVFTCPEEEISNFTIKVKD